MKPLTPLLIALLLPGAFSAASEPAAHPAPPPNVIIIMTDDQGYGDFGFTGNPIIRTPHLDAMASESAQMTQFYVSPVCAPTRASLMTGRYNFRTRAIDTWNGHARMDPDEITLAEILGEAGYATGLFGKWHLGDSYPMRPQDQGFDEVLMHRGGGIGQPSDPDGGEGKYTDPILFHNGKRVSMKGYCTDIYFHEAMDWIEEQADADRPFFAYIPTNAPHAPYHDVPKKLYDEYRKTDLSNKRFPQEVGHPLPEREDLDKRARIYAMITNVDENVGRLMEHLDRLDIDRETLVIFLVDNGPNGNRYVGGFKGMKSHVHEGGIRSPLLLRWPGTLDPETRSDRVSAHIDLTPTILEACGVGIPKEAEMDGRSLLPLLQGKSVDWPDRHIVIQAHRWGGPAIYHHFAVRNQRWKLVHNSGFGNQKFEGRPQFELFDMQADPFAMNDLSARRQDVLNDMLLAYEDWFADVSATRPDNYSAPRIVVGSPFENPVVLTRQDGEQLKGGAFGRGSLGFWKLQVSNPGPYNVQFRFEPVEKEGTATLRIQGQEFSTRVKKGDSSVMLKVHLTPGPVDLFSQLAVGDALYSPWKVNVEAVASM